MKIKGQRVVVCGGGGFIGGHLVKRLKASGASEIRAVDIKPLDEWYQVTPGVENLSLDLRDRNNCYQASEGVDAVFQLAADMGGMALSRTTAPSVCSACSSILICCLPQRTKA